MLAPIKQKELFFQKKLKSFPNYLNLWAIEDDAVIGVDLQSSYVYEFTGIDFLHISDQEIDGFYNSIKNFVHSIPTGTTAQFIIQQKFGDKRKIEEYKKSINTKEEFAKFVIEQKLQQFEGRDYVQRTCLMYITIYPDEINLTRYTTPPVFSLFLPNPKKLEELHHAQVERLKQVSDSITASLRLAGIEIRKLEKKEIIEFFFQYLNPGRSENLEFNHEKLSDSLTLRSQVCFNSAENSFSHFFVDGYYYRAINMFARPSILSPFSIINFLKTIPGEYIFTVSIDSVDQNTLEREVKFEGTIGLALAFFHAYKKYPEAEMKWKDAEGMIQYTKETSQKLYRTSFNMLIRDTTLEELTRNQDTVLSCYRLFGESEGIIDDGQHMFLFLSALPNHSQFNMRKEVFHTEAISMLLPFYQSWQGTEKSRMLFYTKENELLGVDLFDPDLPAKHALVLGTTGSGKSFTTNYLLTNFYIESESNHIVIVDIGGSYKKLVGLLKGEYFEVEISDEYAFNPFPPKQIIIRDETTMSVDSDMLTFLQLFTQKLLQKKTLEPKENLILETAIKNTYKFCKHPVPTLQGLLYQLQNYSEGDEEIKGIAKQFAKNLEWWTKGKYGQMLNRETSLNPMARIVAFDLQKLQKETDLIPLIFFIIQNTIWGKLEDKTLQKIIIFDECWRFFDDEVSAKLIESLYRTARKFNAAIYSISQEPNDFLSSKAAGSVLANSYIKYILMLQKGHEVLEKFGLNKEENEEVKNLTSVRRKYSEIFLKFNKFTQILRIQPNPCDYWICTTDPSDENQIQKIKQEVPDITEIELLKRLMEGV